MLEQIDLEEAEMYVQIAIKNNYKYIQVARIRNGLGPSVMFDFYRLKTLETDGARSDQFEITPETVDYLLDKYPEVKSYI